MHKATIHWLGKSLVRALIFIGILFFATLLISNAVGSPFCSLQYNPLYDSCSIVEQIQVLAVEFLFAVFISFGFIILIPWAYFFYLGYNGKSRRWYVGTAIIVAAILGAYMLANTANMF